MRTVQMHFDAEQLQRINEQTCHDKVRETIGYLTTWGLPGLDACVITPRPADGKMQTVPEIYGAFYKTLEDVETAKRPGYLICAHWNADDQRFSFHS